MHNSTNRRRGVVATIEDAEIVHIIPQLSARGQATMAIVLGERLPHPEVEIVGRAMLQIYGPVLGPIVDTPQAALGRALRICRVE